jgi:predicted transcriptional regulator of viral defense system/very-short-patch-repair endonuclease
VLDVSVNNRAERQAPLDARVASLASRQHGIVTARQLRALGVSPSALRYRVRVGRLHPVHRGVYAVGHRSVSHAGRYLAAVASIGAGAVLSHLSAAALWRLVRSDGDGAVDVAVTRSVRSRQGIRLHVVRSLAATNVTRAAGIPVTTPARTVVDLADVLGERALGRLVHEGEVQGIVSNAELREELRRVAGRRGAAALSALVADGPVRTRSDLEDATYELLRRNGFPRPATNVHVPGVPDWVEVDFHFPGTSLVIEADGDQFHGTRWRRRMDARKQALLEAAGYRVIRLTWEQVTVDEAQTARRLWRALEHASGVPIP